MGHDITPLLKMVEQSDFCRVIAPGFGEAVTSNHLNISSVWKSLVASCSCVAEVQTHAFNALVSSTKVFVSVAKCVRLHAVLQVFVSSTKHVRLQHKTLIVCSISYSDVGTCEMRLSPCSVASVCLQHKTHSSPARNTLVVCNMISYLEVST